MQTLLEQGISFHQQGRLDEAWASYENVLQQDPQSAEALHLSGVIANLRGQHEEAARRIGRAVELSPRQPAFHVNLGNALLELGQSKQAESAFRQAIALFPAFAAAHFNLGNLLLKLEREDEAIGAYDQAIVHEPTHFNALLGLSRILFKRGESALCLALLRRALAIDPGHTAVLRMTAEAQYKLNRFEEAIATLDRLIEMHPHDANLLARKGDALYRIDRLDEATAASRAALAIDPGNLAAISGLADVLNRVGFPSEALSVLREALPRRPDSPELFSNYLFLLNYDQAISPEALLNAHREWERRFCQGIDRAPLPLHANSALPARRLKLGYVSGDFRAHSVSFFIEPILERHSRADFDVFCYSSSRPADAVTERLRSKADVWREVADDDDEALASLIRRDGIDILVDLSGHTGDNRLLCFARKPAPVQLSYLGYPNTTGVSTIDYRVSDAIADPPELAPHQNSETVLYLPDCFHCYRSGDSTPIDPTPASARNGRITFGSFNVLSKVADATLRAWSEILRQVPDARLFLKTRGLAETSAQSATARRLAAFGIDPERLLLSGHDIDHAQHMQRYREVDIALDTFPYNGTTTTCDALWMGIPVVAMRGDRHGSRVGASLLHAVGLDELIAADADDYVERAVALAGDAARLEQLHRTLRARMSASPLMDETTFVRNLEKLYRAAWQDWCRRSSEPASL